MIKATVLCENSVHFIRNAVAEHGWAVYVQTPHGDYLWDTGPGAGILRNAVALGIDLRRVQAALLSHGHFDHTGGLEKALRLAGEILVYAHPDLFQPAYSCHTGEHIGVPFTREYLESLGAQFDLSRAWRQIAPGMYLSGEIPRHTSFEKDGDRHLLYKDGMKKECRIMDDQCLVLDTERGLCIILGCAHAGVINTVDYVLAQTGRSKIAAIIGGTHLGPAGEEQRQKSIEALLQYDIGRIGVSHCTGFDVAVQMREAFGERFFQCTVGEAIEV